MYINILRKRERESSKFQKLRDIYKHKISHSSEFMDPNNTWEELHASHQFRPLILS